MKEKGGALKCSALGRTFLDSGLKIFELITICKQRL